MSACFVCAEAADVAKEYQSLTAEEIKAMHCNEGTRIDEITKVETLSTCTCQCRPQQRTPDGYLTDKGSTPDRTIR